MDYEISEEIITRKQGDDIFILDLNGRVLHMLNETASYIWDKLYEGCDIELLPKNLSEEFEVSIDTAKRDVEEFLSVLREKSIIK